MGHKTALIAAVAALGISASLTPAMAADLGGNCCADLEERIAELEATTARKGNRKVSLTITGWVVETLTYWDDGVEQNVYVGGPGITLASHVKFTGAAQVSPDVKVGYTLHLEFNHNDTVLTSQETDNAPNPGLPNFANGVFPFESSWFMESKSLGKVTVGKTQSATDNVAIVGVDNSGTIFSDNSPDFGAFLSFRLRRNGAQVGGGAGATWGQLDNCALTNAGIGADCTAVPGNFVRYDAPAFAGIKLSAAWGEDDTWDVAMRYNGEGGGFLYNLGMGYSHSTDEDFVVPTSGKRDEGYFQLGGYLQHVATGLFFYGTYGTDTEVNNPNYSNAVTGFSRDEGEMYMLKTGARLKLFNIGHTIPYFSYRKTTDMLDEVLIAANATGSEIDRYRVGVTQEIDAAHMHVWAAYTRWEGEISGPAACGALCGDLDDFQRVEVGAFVPF